LNKLNSLKIQLLNDNSKWIIKRTNQSKNSNITLKELRIEKNTKINALKYDSYHQLLSFNMDLKKEESVNAEPGKLKINLGNEPIKITIENFIMSDFSLPNQTNNTLNFLYTPRNSTSILPIRSHTRFNIILSKNLKPNDSEQWFKNNIDAEAVRFINFDKNSKPQDDVSTSTILKGTIRMADQQREVQENQFIMGSSNEIIDNPLNIKRLVYLRIVKTGVEARFSGQTSKLQIGLDPKLPISTIQGSWLDGFLPRDLIIAIFALGGGAIANLIAGLVGNRVEVGKTAPLPSVRIRHRRIK
jgi:hypothetical protein